MLVCWIHGAAVLVALSGVFSVTLEVKSPQKWLIDCQREAVAVWEAWIVPYQVSEPLKSGLVGTH